MKTENKSKLVQNQLKSLYINDAEKIVGMEVVPDMKLTKNHPLFNAFMSLSCALSPENVSCDGERSIAETRRRYTSLRKQWNKLENKFGRGVSEGEVWAVENA